MASATGDYLPKLAALFSHLEGAADAATYLPHVLEELRGIRVLLALLAGVPAVFPPLPEVKTVT